MKLFKRFFSWMTNKVFEEEEPYLGWTVWYPTDDDWAALETDKNFVPQVAKTWKNNEYILAYVKDLEANKEKLVAQYCYEDGKLRKFGRKSIAFDFKQLKMDDTADTELEQFKNKSKGESKQKTKAKDYSRVISPRNEQQICAFDLLFDNRKTIKLLTGTWGTGKTMLLVGAALDRLCKGEFEQIIWIRNNVDVANTKDLGALPGDKNEKLMGFLGPFIDHAGKRQVEKMLATEQLVIQPLQDLRGRNFANAIIMCSESENLTKEHIQLIIARAAQGAEVWLDGDCRQRDKAAFERSQGLEKMINKFKNKKLFGYIHLIKSERSETAAMADLLNE